MPDVESLLGKVTKPARYAGGEWNSIVKDWDSADVRIALSYPDVYEIGMSNLGLAIIYDLLNRREGVLAERVFAPWVDMERELRDRGVQLFTLESKRALSDFDILGFSLGYELTYANVVNMLDLAGIPVLSRDRGDSLPLIIGGGTCSLNPEPVADFFDLFVVGEGEEVIVALLDVLRAWKRRGSGLKDELLQEAARIPGVYVPRFYEVAYCEDATMASIKPTIAEAPPTIVRRVADSLPPALTRPIVPYLQVIHDRAAVEIQRGCHQGCRFCQAGIIYRPVRTRTHDEILAAVDDLIRNCGYDEISLLSLSTTDYPDIAGLMGTLARKYQGKNVTLSLPSLRLDTFSVALADSYGDGKKAGFTFAPEAGSERLRRAINKGISDDDIIQAVETAWQRGWKSVKLYFMIGLPTETVADVEDIVHLVRRIKKIGSGRINVRINASTFVPKPHTPFQWVPQASAEYLDARQQELRAGLKRAGVQISWQSPEVSMLEGVMSRGDRRLSHVILHAWKLGARFDAWSEHFDPEIWQRAFSECGIDPHFYSTRQRSLDEVLPWSHIDSGISLDYLKREYDRTSAGEGTPNCSDGRCNACGLQDTQQTCRERLRPATAAASTQLPPEQ